jgi:rare lipoprotein A
MTPPPWCARAAWALAALLLGACATRPGHYYGDDGPPDHVPAGLAATPDAVPRDEPINPYANRPYKALGRTYVPDTSDAPFSQRGMASWYGRQFQGNRTASGEPYDMFAMTAAHPTLPIPSYARVTNLRDGRSVIVRINDRGPFLYDRVIDLSYAAATRLGIAGPGSGEVLVEKITPRMLAAQRAASPPPAVAASAPADTPAARGGATMVAAATPPAAPATTPTLAATTVSAPLIPAGGGAGALPNAELPVPASAPPAPPSIPAPAAPAPAPETGAAYAGGESPLTDGSPARSWSIQLGAFAVAANAAALRDRLALLLSAPEAAALPPAARTPRVEHDGRLSRVLIGSLGDRAQALAWSQQLERFLARSTTLYLH